MSKFEEKFKEKVAKELKKNCYEVYKMEDMSIRIDRDNFPEKAVRDVAVSVKLNLTKTVKKLTEYISENEPEINKKDKIKLSAKAVSKAVDKYIDELSNGYEPENLEQEMSSYVAKKSVKYFGKAVERLEKKAAKETEAKPETGEEKDVDPAEEEDEKDL